MPLDLSRIDPILFVKENISKFDFDVSEDGCFDVFDFSVASDRMALEQMGVVGVSERENFVVFPSGFSGKVDLKVKFSRKSANNVVLIGNVFSLRGTVSFNSNDCVGVFCRSDQKITISCDFRGRDNRIIVGPNTSINGANLLADGDSNRIKIDQDCMLSYGIRIRTSDSHAIVDLKARKQINQSRDVVIGPRVWIASNVMILKGITVGEGSIVAASSVVTKAIPPVSLAAGVPARVIRKNVSWSRAGVPKQAEIDRIADHFEAAGLLDELD